MPEKSTAARAIRLSHVGIALRANADLAGLLREILGMEPVPLNDSDGARIEAFRAGEALVELLEPAAPGSPIAKFLERRGPGIHHLCLAVEDLEATLERCRQSGIRLVDEAPRIGAEGRPIAFLHPSSTGGVLVELTQL